VWAGSTEYSALARAPQIFIARGVFYPEYPFYSFVTPGAAFAAMARGPITDSPPATDTD